MKSISEVIKKMKQEDLDVLAGLLNLKKGKDKDIITSMLSISGLSSLLSRLSSIELELIKIVYNKNESMTFGDIEKNLNIPIPEIERITENLCQKLLITRIKNRQMLTNKLDKIYRLKEISDLLNVSDNEKIANHLKKIINNLEFYHRDKDRYSKNQPDFPEFDKLKDLIELIISSGFIIDLDSVKKIITRKSIDEILAAQMKFSIIKVFYSFEGSSSFYLSLNEEMVPNLIHKFASGPDTELSVHNRYYAVLNVLNAFDTISTFGLFLTKQNIFRKIDKKRIADSMHSIYAANGDKELPEKCSALSLFFLYELQCLKLNKDIASISLKNLREDLPYPHMIVARMLQALINYNPSRKNEYFPAPVDPVKFRIISLIINNLIRLESAPPGFLKIVTLSGLKIDSYARTSELTGQFSRESSDFDEILNILSILGIIEIQKGLVMLSDVGQDMLPHMQVHGFNNEPIHPVRQKTEPAKCIYINPDFSLIIPVDDISSSALYHILTHTDIIKQDFITHAVITKSAIVKAHKRGMTSKKFHEQLNIYSKNEVPQNLTFLLKEWANQTTNIKIFQAVLLKANQSSFFDEVMSGKLKEAIIEQISPSHAIINLDYIDEIIKVARKYDAVISIFEE